MSSVSCRPDSAHVLLSCLGRRGCFAGAWVDGAWVDGFWDDGFCAYGLGAGLRWARPALCILDCGGQFGAVAEQFADQGALRFDGPARSTISMVIRP